MRKDITYCQNRDCPFQDCERNLKNLTDPEDWVWLWVSNFDGTCRRYISWLAEEVQNEGN